VTALVRLLAQARRAQLFIDQAPGGRLVIRGDHQHEQLAQALLARKPDVLTVVHVLNGRAPRLDWHRARVADSPSPCILCRRNTLLRDPWDGKPCHKTCLETAIRWGAAPDAATAGRVA
jgi:hypothetical protein